jgi:ABC-type phosphate transport system substrate-binding protein
MSFLRRARAPVRATLLAAVAALALGSVGAGTAAANRPCMGTTITGASSATLRTALAAWTAGFNTNSAGCPGPGAPAVTTSTGPGSGATPISTWGLGGCASATFSFIATESAPTVTDRAAVEQPTGTCGGTGTRLLVNPVAQYAIAIVVNLPASCALARLTQAQVETAFRGTATVTWASLGGTGPGCTSAISRMVPSAGAAATYQMKHFFSVANGASFCSGSPTTWTALQAPTLNTTWCDDARSLTHTANVVSAVNATTGSIGFATTADAVALRTAATTIVDVRNTLTYQPPKTTGNDANCATATGTYQNAARTLPPATGTWTDVYMVNAGSQYPYCALSWIMALQDYQPLWGTPLGLQVGQTVSDFLTYILNPAGGPVDAAGRYYAALPSDVSAQSAAGVASIVTMP